MPSLKWLFRKTVGFPGFQPATSSPCSGRIMTSLPVCGSSSRKTRDFPLGCHDMGNCGFWLSVRRWTSPVPSAALPVEVLCLVRARRREGDAAAVGSPYRVAVVLGVERQAGHRVPPPLVHPHVALGSVTDVHRQPPAVGRETDVDYSVNAARRARVLPCRVQPLERHLASGARARKEHECALVGKREVRPGRGRVGGHAFERRHGGTRQLQTVEVEGSREERPHVDVDEVAAPDIASVIAASLHDLAWTARQRLDGEVRVVEAARRAEGGEEDRPASRQRLRPAVGPSGQIGLGQGLWRPAGRGDT